MRTLKVRMHKRGERTEGAHPQMQIGSINVGSSVYRAGRAALSTASAARLTREGQAPGVVRFSLEADEDSERCATVNRATERVEPCCPLLPPLV